jgi:hypothetical protein
MRSGTRCAAALTAAATLLAACGSSGNGEAGKSAGAILSDVSAAVRGAHSYRLIFSGKDASGDINFEIDVAGKNTAKGSLTSGGATAEFVYTGTTFYLRGRKFFDKVAGAAVGQRIGDHWVSLPAASAGTSQLQEFTDPGKLADCIGSQHGTLSKGGTSSVNGSDAVVVVDAGDKPGTSPGKLYVATSGTPFPLKLEQTGPAKAGGTDTTCGGNSTLTQGSGVFDQYNSSISVTAPKGALDISTLG